MSELQEAVQHPKQGFDSKVSGMHCLHTAVVALDNGLAARGGMFAEHDRHSQS